MSKKYKLSYTAAEIDERLGTIDQLSEDVEQLATNLDTSKIHASQHSSDGSDPIIPKDIGAMSDVPVTTSDNGKFLCVVNGDWAAVSAVIGDNGNSITTIEMAIKDGNGNIIVDTYETKTDANAKLAEAKSYTDASLVEAKSYADTAIETALANIAKAENMEF